jgi:hypothetical protein
MDEESVEIVIGGEPVVFPPMTFWVLRRAWPHILTLGKMEAVQQQFDLVTAKLVEVQERDPPATPEELANAESAHVTAMEKVLLAGADFTAQIEEKLHVLAWASALTDHPISHDELAKRLRRDEFTGLAVGFNHLLRTSGLLSGEAAATGLAPPRKSTGLDLRLN